MPDCGVHYLWFAFVCFLIRSHPPWPALERADPNVLMAKAKAQSAATESGTELVCAAVQQGKTLN